MKILNLKLITLIAGLTLLVVGKVWAIGAGEMAPDFTLPDTLGQQQQLSKYQGKFVVLEWTNPECPFVKKHYNSHNMQDLQKIWGDKGVVWLSICSSAKGKQGFYGANEWTKIQKEREAAPAATLLDPDGKVGRLYGAKTTPHLFIVNQKGSLIYKGAIDDKPSVNPEDVKEAKNFVTMALEEALANKQVRFSSTQSYGCSIKYK